MPEPFHGVLAALITPFTEDGSTIDAEALAAIVDRLVAAGVAGLVPGGSTGEFTTLSHGSAASWSRPRWRRPRAACRSSPAPAHCRRARPSSSAFTPSARVPPR